MNRTADQGAALILAILILSFIAVLGGALLTTTTMDLWISDNYKTRMQSLFLAEAGIERARELLRLSGPSSNQPFLSGGDDIGTYQVSLSNGVGDTFVLTSTALAGNSRKKIETTVRKGGFPLDESDPRLTTIAGLERFAKAISDNATDRWGGPVSIGNYGSPTDYRVAVTDGDCTFGPGTGYGLMLVRGILRISGGFSWTGLIVVIGQGVVMRDTDAMGQVIGGIFAVRTRDDAGNLLSVPGPITYDRNDLSSITKANASFPYTPVAVREN